MRCQKNRSVCLFASVTMLQLLLFMCCSVASASQSDPLASKLINQLAKSQTHTHRLSTPAGAPEHVGNLQHPDLVEVSGMAKSLLDDNVFWMINDSGNGSELYAINTVGESLGVWSLSAPNDDWEDMTSFLLNGEPYLLVADIGDNARNRKEYQIYIFNEPRIPTVEQGDDLINSALSPLKTIRFVYPDGPHNSEALATDGQWLYIMTKASKMRSRHSISSLYRLPLSLASGEDLLVAELLGDMPKRTQKSDLIKRNSKNTVSLKKPTAFEIDDKNDTGYLLTYSYVVRVDRHSQQTWAEAILEGGRAIHHHRLKKAESLTLSKDNKIWFSSEGKHAPLWVLPAATD